MLAGEEKLFEGYEIPRYRLVTKWSDGFVKHPAYSNSLETMFLEWEAFMEDDTCYYNVITTVEDDQLVLGYELPYVPVKKKVAKKRIRG